MHVLVKTSEYNYIIKTVILLLLIRKPLFDSLLHEKITRVFSNNRHVLRFRGKR